jgi:hypothetical protein
VGDAGAGAGDSAAPAGGVLFAVRRDAAILEHIFAAIWAVSTLGEKADENGLDRVVNG